MASSRSALLRNELQTKFLEKGNRQMPKQLIVAVFDSVDVAQKAGHDFRATSEKNEGFHIESCVLVQKDAAGKIIVLDTETRSFWGAVIGALTGSLIGMLGGPVGSAVGLAVGASAGATADTVRMDMLDREFVETVSNEILPRRVALIVEAKESTPFSVDNIVQSFGGTAFRRPVN